MTAILGGKRPCVGGIDRPAGGAGNTNKIQLFNPAGTNILATVHGIIATPAAVTAIDLRAVSAQLSGTTQNESVRDSRFGWGVAGLTACVITFVEDATSGGFLIGQLKTTDALVFPIEFKLSPGFGLQLRCVTANVGLTVTFAWDEQLIDNL